MLAAMSAQRIATGIGLIALAGLLLSVGLPVLLPPAPVAEIEIVVPTEDSDEPAESPETIPPGRLDDPDDDEDDDGDGPDDSPDDSPDDDGEDGDD
jgi:hypothetical protein